MGTEPAAKKPRGNYCPRCHGETKVIKTRHGIGRTIRRRACVDCGFRATSDERARAAG